MWWVETLIQQENDHTRNSTFTLTDCSFDCIGRVKLWGILQSTGRPFLFFYQSCIVAIINRFFFQYDTVDYKVFGCFILFPLCTLIIRNSFKVLYYWQKLYPYNCHASFATTVKYYFVMCFNDDQTNADNYTVQNKNCITQQQNDISLCRFLLISISMRYLFLFQCFAPLIGIILYVDPCHLFT